MKIGFCLFRYFPFGGLQRDFFKIAGECLRRGHQVQVFAGGWEGASLVGAEITLIKPRGWSNHARCQNFSQDLRPLLAASRPDVVIGFNKLPGLDFYFAADPCYLWRVQNGKWPLYRLSSRFRVYAEMEKAVFAPDSGTHILVLADTEKHHYMQSYGTPAARFHLLPPGIDRTHIDVGNRPALRASVREELGITDDELLLLMIGSGFKTKGLDRSVRALAALPNDLRCRTQLVVVGQGRPGPFRKLASTLGVERQVRLLGGRDDVPRFLVGADLLVHPSYTEAYGMVLLEALVAGLPVLVTDVCGYVYHVERAGAGCVIPSPFSQEVMNRLLEQMLRSPDSDHWRQNGMAYADRTDLFSLPGKAVDLIEALAIGKASHA